MLRSLFAHLFTVFSLLVWIEMLQHFLNEIKIFDNLIYFLDGFGWQKLIFILISLLKWLFSVFFHIFCCLMEAVNKVRVGHFRDLHILPALVSLSDVVPVLPIWAFLYFVVDLYLLVISESFDEFFYYLSVFLKFFIRLLLRIWQRDNGIVHLWV
jgi:hypothetical protein